jgi:hypothetical protein
MMKKEMYPMPRNLKTHIVRLWTSSMLACLLAMSALALHSSPTFAQPPCDPNAPLNASGGVGASCDMSIAADLGTGSLTLANDAAVAVTGSPFTLTGAPITAPFSFTSVVKDHLRTTAGWQLQANLLAGGLTDGTTHINQVDLTNTSVSCVNGNGSCVFNPPTPFTLQAGLGAQTFESAGNGSTVVEGDYTNDTTGTFTFPASANPGHYTGTVTITLLNSF